MTNNNQFKVYTDHEIDDVMWIKLLECETRVLAEAGFAMGEALKDCYKVHKEGVIVVVDGDSVVGFFNVLFLSDAQKSNLQGLKYWELRSIGPRIGDNNFYFFTAAIDKEYRGSEVVKLLCRELVRWCNDFEERGVRIASFTGEAVLPGGVRLLSNVFGMKPMGEVNEEGLGFYYSPDCLKQYRNEMNCSGDFQSPKGV